MLREVEILQNHALRHPAPVWPFKRVTGAHRNYRHLASLFNPTWLVRHSILLAWSLFDCDTLIRLRILPLWQFSFLLLKLHRHRGNIFDTAQQS